MIVGAFPKRAATFHPLILLRLAVQPGDEAIAPHDGCGHGDKLEYQGNDRMTRPLSRVEKGIDGARNTAGRRKARKFVFARPPVEAVAIPLSAMRPTPPRLWPCSVREQTLCGTRSMPRDMPRRREGTEPHSFRRRFDKIVEKYR